MEVDVMGKKMGLDIEPHFKVRMTADLHVNIPRLQRIQLNERPARFHIIPH
jgi:hypothetical protein